MIKKVTVSLCAALCGLITACPAQTATPTSPSQFPDTLHTVQRHASNLVRVDPSAVWARYQSVRLAPAVYEPNSLRHRLKDDEIRKVESTVNQSLEKTFKQPIKTEGRLLEVRPVITHFRRTNTLLNVLGFAAIQAPISFGAASIRYELFDTESGACIGVVSSERKARPWNVYPWNVLYNFQALGQGSVILKRDSRTLWKDVQHLRQTSAGIAPASALGME